MIAFRLSSNFHQRYPYCLTNCRLCSFPSLRMVIFSLFGRRNSTIVVNSSSKITPNDLKPPWRIIFFGSDSFAIKSLQLLCSKYRTGTIIETLHVSTTFNEKSIKKNPVYEFAKSEKLTLYQWPSLCDDLRGTYDIGVVVSFGHLIPENIIASFPLGILNVHASLLPRWRGAAPVIRAIMNGDTETGITIMKIKSKKFDIGDVVRQYKVTIHPEESAKELTNRLADLGARLLIECIRDLPRSVLSATPQSSHGFSYARKVSKKDAEIDWGTKSAAEVYALFRALNHLYPLTTWWFNHPLKLYDIKLDDITDFNPANRDAISMLKLENPIFPGLVEFSFKRSVIRVQCKDGRWISVSNIRMPSKKNGKTCLTASEFYNGYVNKVQNTLDRKFGFRKDENRSDIALNHNS